MSRRVVVTGMSVITALGSEIPEFWDRLCAGKSGVGRLERFRQRRQTETRTDIDQTARSHTSRSVWRCGQSSASFRQTEQTTL